MKKLLAVIVAALMLGSFAVTASAADLANYAKDATATEWTAGETEGTTVIEYDLGGIKPLGYYETHGATRFLPISLLQQSLRQATVTATLLQLQATLML